MENDLQESLYSKEQLKQLKNSPEVFREKLESRKSLPDLSGIEIHIVFLPKDKEDDNEFQIVSDFYRKMLEAKGARVFISANLNKIHCWVLWKMVLSS